MRNKKKCISILLASSVLGSCFILSSVAEVDDILDKATEITKEIFTANLEEGEMEIGYIFSSYLQGMDGADDYILSQCSTGGYAIYEKESMELIEYSDTDKSPYATIEEGKRYYAGPVNYYVSNGDNLENVHTKERISKKYGEKIAKEFKEKTKADRKERKEKSKNSEQSNVVSAENESLASSTPPGYSDLYSADSYTVERREYISNYQYFIGNHGHGYNFDGTCASVAVQLLLAYNNWANDGRLIPRETGNSAEQFLHEDWTESGRDEPYSDVMRATNSTDISDDGIISFYEKLKEYINPYARSYNERDEEEHWLNKGATMEKTKDGIAEYVYDYAYDLIEDLEIRYSSPPILTDEIINNLYTSFKQEINNDRPAIASISLYITNDEGELEKSGHEVVVYGYQTITIGDEELNGVIAHFGWKRLENGEDPTNIWFNSTWLTGIITFKTTHQHTIGKTITSGHVYECSECRGVFLRGEHTQKDSEPLETEDFKYNGSHTAICYCGYKYEKKHDFYYEYLNEDLHLCKCLCGFEPTMEYHYYKEYFCFFCEYEPLL